MSKFNLKIYENAKRLKLKRVQIKCDPSLANSLDFSNVSTYEGYILEESSETISVMIIKQDLPVIDVIPSNITQTEEPHMSSFKLASFKEYLTPLFQSGDPLLSQIKQTK
jgi:hypothetical protein